VLEVVVM